MSGFTGSSEKSSAGLLRHCQVQLSPREQHYEQLRVYMPPQSDCAGVAANSELLAYIDSEGSGSCLGVLPHSSTGKNHVPINSPAYKQPLIRAHSQAVQDFCFHPFERHTLFSCSTDKTIKMWQLPPEGLVVDMASATCVFGLASKTTVRGLAAHPSASTILAARGSREIGMFDLSAEQPKEVYSLSTGFSGDIMSMNWSSLGDLLTVTSKDKFLRCFDPRQSASVGAVVQVNAHEGTRFSRCVWLGHGSPYCLTVGHNNAQEREMKVWDIRTMNSTADSGSSHVLRERIDSGGTGSLLPLLDSDLGLLAVMGKGDASLRLYELRGCNGIISRSGPIPAAIIGSETDGGSLSETAQVVGICNGHIGGTSTDVTRGACLLPKVTNDRMGCEVLRLLKLADGVIQPVQVRVPRAEKQKYHSDLFPPTLSEHSAAMSAADWLSGSDARPEPISLPAITAPDLVENSDVLEDDKLHLEAAPQSAEEVAERQREERRSVAISKRLSSLGSSSKFRNMYGREFVKEKTYYDLAPDLTCIDSPLIACNERYWAIPYRGGGGPFYISTHSQYGKVASHCATVNGHKAPVQDIHFSPFHTHLLVTGSADSTVKIWDASQAFTEEIIAAMNASTAKTGVIDNASLAQIQPTLTLSNHKNSIRTCCFHPTVSQLLCSTSQDMTLRFFDAEAGEEVSCMEIADAVTVNKSFNFDGTLLAIAGKDKQFRIVDPRLGKVISSTNVGADLTPSGSRRISAANFGIGRNLRVMWCAAHNRISGSEGEAAVSWGTDPICTVCSSSSTGMRQLQFWDPRNLLGGPVCTKSIDNASGQLFPIFDEDMNAVMVAGKGDTIVRMYHIQYLHPSLQCASVDGKTTETKSTPSGEEENEKTSATEEDDAVVEPVVQDKLLPMVVEKCPEFQSGREPIAGIGMLPKRCCDVRDVEVARVLKLTNDSLTPITFKVPRSDHLKEYFHEDLFPLSRAKYTLATVPDWEAAVQELKQGENKIDDSIFAPQLESLRPEGMVTVAEKPPAPAPSASRSSIRMFREEIKKAEEETQQREESFARLQQLAIQNAQYNKNKSGPVKIGGVVVSQPDESSDSDAGWSDDD